jgi:pimeloyl-ACP methyl ester carboxylesterase
MKRFFKYLGILIAILLIAGFAIGYTPDSDPAAMKAKYGSASSQFIDVGGGLKLHARDEGKRDGPVLVLLHGSNASLQTWEPWVAQLGSRYRVISLDQIGHGLTGANPTNDYSPKAFVDTLDAALTKIGVSKFALAGNSMGGGIAVHYVLAHPEKLSALILVDAGGAPNSEPKSTPIGFKVARMPVIKELVRYITPRSIIEKSMHQTLANDAIIDDKMIDRYWELLRYPGNREATGYRFSAPRVPFDAAALGKIAIPTLVMWGKEDQLIPVSAADWFTHAIPGAQEVIYPGIGHIPMEEAAGQSANDVDAFLKGIATPSPK